LSSSFSSKIFGFELPALVTEKDLDKQDLFHWLDIAREIGTFWKENKAHIWLPNIKQGFFGITRPTAEEMAKYR
jgi:hypothetical protein